MVRGSTVSALESFGYELQAQDSCMVETEIPLSWFSTGKQAGGRNSLCYHFAQGFSMRSPLHSCHEREATPSPKSFF